VRDTVACLLLLDDFSFVRDTMLLPIPRLVPRHGRVASGSVPARKAAHHNHVRAYTQTKTHEFVSGKRSPKWINGPE
jgi:hypothetical protein